jgi:hypothetical protein
MPNAGTVDCYQVNFIPNNVHSTIHIHLATFVDATASAVDKTFLKSQTKED